MSGKEKSSEIQPELIQNIYWGYAKTQVLSTALELDVFTQIHQGNSTVEKLARRIGAPLRSTRILLDALTAIGLLGKTRDSYKVNAEARAFLVHGEANYLGGFFLDAKMSYERWGHLTEAVKKGKPVEGMTELGNRKAFFKDLVKALFPVSFASGVILGKKLGVGNSLKNLKILDVGCGSAAWSLAFAAADRGSEVVAVDYPEILEVAQSFVKRFHVTKQYEFRGGDFHEINFGREAFDIIILGHICHGEGESESRRLFKKAFDALKSGGKLLIAEFMANDLRTGPEIPLLFALNMVLFTEAGDVFTLKEMKRWLGLAGFKKVSALGVQYPCSVIVATK
jgi:SAM-dependent methyltransferase